MHRALSSGARNQRSRALVAALRPTSHSNALPRSTPWLLSSSNGRPMAVTATTTVRAMSSFEEPDPTLFVRSASSDTNNNDGNADDPQQHWLRRDIRVLGSLLGKVVRNHEGADVFAKVEALRGMAKQWRAAGAGRQAAAAAEAEAAFQQLASTVSQLSDQELYIVSRAFTHFLALANAAEAHHRIRKLREAQRRDSDSDSPGALYPKPDSCGGVIPNLLQEGHSPDAIYNALTQQTTELVLTAHPTEVNRRTILHKNRRLQEILILADQYRDTTATTKYEQAELDRALQAEIASLWMSDEVARTKPTPETEAEKGTLVVETVLWEAVPQFLRQLNAVCQYHLGKSLPVTAAPIKFASWMGGDRDGNPNVKPDTTRLVCWRNRSKAAGLLAHDLKQLERQFSITTCSDALRDKVGPVREPYRALLRPMIAKLQTTQAWAQQEMLKVQGQEGSATLSNPISEQDVYLSKAELMEELELIRSSLLETGNDLAVDGILVDVLRNLSAFGLTLIPLDVRQESTRHEEALDCITRYLGLGSYAQWDETTKLNWLSTQIASKRPLIRPGAWEEESDYFTATARDTLGIFQMIAEQHEDSLGAYVISQATSASDVLAVLLLQMDAGVKQPLRIAPLFETLSDLQGAVDTMRTLWSLPAYRGIIQNRQEVMIGYSDSAKDAGRLAASWAQYETQEQLAELAVEMDVDLTFFHGKGGTVGRGGNPQTYLAILSHAPNTIRGHFRVTEQGEMISQNFGFGDRAQRTLDIYTAAVLAEQLTDRPAPSAEYRNLMKELSDVSCEAYRQVVRHDQERFVPYFRSATPEPEFARLNIGSRPAKRVATGGVESLRAIPWNFAWTQTRFNLPTWLGVGHALNAVLQDAKKAPLLRQMYKDWGSFRAMVDVVEMVLAKSEPAIAHHYEQMLVDKSATAAQDLGTQVRQAHLETERAVLDLTQHDVLSQHNVMLQRQMSVRNPYVDCLNVLQAETLQRLRSRNSEDTDKNKTLQDTLLITITGVANGMGNTG